jgi:hypothetical protein
VVILRVRGIFKGRGMSLPTQTKLVLTVLGKDLKIDVTKEMSLSDNRCLYSVGMKPSVIACALIWINHPKSRNEFPKLGNCTPKYLIMDVKKVKRLLKSQ